MASKQRKPALVVFHTPGFLSGLVRKMRIEPTGQNFEQLHFTQNAQLKEATWSRVAGGWELSGVPGMLTAFFSDSAIKGIFWQDEETPVA